MPNLITVTILAIIIILLSTICGSTDAAGLSSNRSFTPGCTHHFYLGIPPARRSNCTVNMSACVDLCHGEPTDARGYFATLQNTRLRAPEYSAALLDYVEMWRAQANDFPRPSWKLNNAIADNEQYPLSVPLWDGTGPYDKGHLLSKEVFDYSSEAVRASMDITNVVPQLDQCNRGEWLSLEKDTRDWIRERNRSIYCVIAIGYENPAAPRIQDGIVVPDFMVSLLCDPVAKSSVALVARSAEDNCGGTLQKLQSVRYVENNFLNGSRVFDESCRPCELNNSHWFTLTRYSPGNSTPELCATTSTSAAMTTTSTTTTTAISPTPPPPTSTTVMTTTSTSTATASGTTTSSATTTTASETSSSTTTTSEVAVSSSTTTTATSSLSTTTSLSSTTSLAPPPPVTSTTTSIAPTTTSVASSSSSSTTTSTSTTATTTQAPPQTTQTTSTTPTTTAPTTTTVQATTAAPTTQPTQTQQVCATIGLDSPKFAAGSSLSFTLLTDAVKADLINKFAPTSTDFAVRAEFTSKSATLLELSFCIPDSSSSSSTSVARELSSPSSMPSWLTETKKYVATITLKPGSSGSNNNNNGLTVASASATLWSGGTTAIPTTTVPSATGCDASWSPESCTTSLIVAVVIPCAVVLLVCVVIAMRKRNLRSKGRAITRVTNDAVDMDSFPATTLTRAATANVSAAGSVSNYHPQIHHQLQQRDDAVAGNDELLNDAEIDEFLNGLEAEFSATDADVGGGGSSEAKPYDLWGNL